MILILPTLWWLFFFTALGLCLGSFANVLIHRLPIDGSPREPQWSVCPHCQTRIRWYENIPVLSYIFLHGRCRNCKLPISVRYPIVELAMGLVFVSLADAFLIAPGRAGLNLAAYGATDRLLSDWPIVLAHLILFFSLFVMSAIDIEHYWVDIRFSNAAVIAGFVLHALWTPKSSLAHWPRPDALAAGVSVAVLLGLLATWALWVLAPMDQDDDDAAGLDEAAPQTGDEPLAATSPYQSREAGSRWPILLPVLVLVAVWAMAGFERGEVLDIGASWRLGLIAAVLFILILVMGLASRPSDEAVYEAIEEESHTARTLAVEEGLMLLPAAVCGAVVAWLLMSNVQLRESMETLLHHTALDSSSKLLGAWQPLTGLATAACGFVVGGALGWAIRIVFTIAFGKEAFGTGDIHMMAAAGCVAGWPVVVLGFFLACFMAMIGWLAALPFKRTRAVPLGPWLSLGFLVVVLFYQPIVSSRLVRNVTQAVSFLLESPEDSLSIDVESR